MYFQIPSQIHCTVDSDTWTLQYHQNSALILRQSYFQSKAELEGNGNLHSSSGSPHHRDVLCDVLL